MMHEDPQSFRLNLYMTSSLVIHTKRLRFPSLGGAMHSIVGRSVPFPPQLALAERASAEGRDTVSSKSQVVVRSVVDLAVDYD